MEQEWKDQGKKGGFTIIELLTVMSIIVILISLLTPALNRVRRYSMDVKQRAQFHSIGVALDLFNSEFDGYPDSSRYDSSTANAEYCGAMKLAEAMVGQDLKGFNPKSKFRRDGMDSDVPPITNLYPPNPGTGTPTYPAYLENLKSRKMYLELDNANAYQIKDIYDTTRLTNANFVVSSYVLCDSYNRVTNKTTGKKMGMPILYYKADTAKSAYPDGNTAPGTMATDGRKGIYIYNFDDNQQLIDMDNAGMPWLPPDTYVHHLATGGTTLDGLAIAGADAYPKTFYDIIRDKKIDSGDRPCKADSYILISAGYDGDYGTKDDIYNFMN